MSIGSLADLGVEPKNVKFYIELELLGVSFQIHCECGILRRWILVKYAPHVRSGDNLPKSGRSCFLYIASLGGGYEFRSSSRTLFVSSNVVTGAVNEFVVLYLNSVLPDAVLLHGSCVRIGSEATALLGSSKSGKTTLSIALHAIGHPKLCDDIIPLRLSDGEICPFNHHPTLRPFTRTFFNKETLSDSIRSGGARIAMRRVIFLQPRRYEMVVSSPARQAYTSNWGAMYEFIYGEALNPEHYRSDNLMSLGEPDFREKPELSTRLTTFELARKLLQYSYPFAHPLLNVLSKLAASLKDVDGYILCPGRLEQTVEIIRKLEQ